MRRKEENVFDWVRAGPRSGKQKNAKILLTRNLSNQYVS